MLSRAANFIARPYDNDMDAIDWFLLIGLLVVAALFWSTVYRHILEGID